MADRTWEKEYTIEEIEDVLRKARAGFASADRLIAKIEAAERAKAEPVCGHCHGSGRSQGLCCSGDTCGKCNPGGATAEPAATAARERSPVAALLAKWDSSPLMLDVTSALQDAIAKQCADWRRDAYPDTSAFHQGYAAALRQCASDLSGWTGGGASHSGAGT